MELPPILKPEDHVPSRRRNIGIVLFFGVLALLLIVGSIGVMLYNATVSQSPEVRAHATATARASAAARAATGTAGAYATGTAYANATITAVVAATATMDAAYPDTYAPNDHATLFLYDPMSKADQWKPDQSSPGGYCRYVSAAYHIKESQTGYTYHCFSKFSISNFAFEVQMRVLSGDCGGLDFRAQANGKEYEYTVCQDGSFSIWVDKDNNVNNNRELIGSQSSAIKKGLGQPNTLAVVAKGTTLVFYINHTKLYSANDTTSDQGSIGLIADSSANQTETTFSSARLWSL
jgi:eukaryotic-like serine/threonine-protein kinase